jgi:hypothetical protein
MVEAALVSRPRQWHAHNIMLLYPSALFPRTVTLIGNIALHDAQNCFLLVLLTFFEEVSDIHGA